MLWWSNSRRLLRIAWILIRHGAAHAVGSGLSRWPRLARRLPPADLPRPERLRSLLEDLGGTFIKFGQMLALQPDILPFEYCDALFNLLDRVAPFPEQQVNQVFILELGQKPSEIFDSFEPRPLATASVGQVHIATLKGRKLAVKVRRPNVETDFAGDIRLLLAFISLIKRLKLARLYWLIEPMSEFVGWTRDELDFRNEARYMEQLGRASHEKKSESVPEVLWEYTTARLLVTDFLEGVTVLDYLRAREAGDAVLIQRLKRRGFDPNIFARNIIDNFLGDAIQHGLFHADLHPANLMILPDSVVGYIDFGITGVLSHYSRQNLVSLTLAYTRGDLEGMCSAFFKVSALDANSDVQAFRNGLQRLTDQWYAMEGKDRRLKKNFTMVMLDMLLLSRKTGIWPERDVIKYIRSSIAVDGLITRFAPGFNVGQHLAEVCDLHLKWEARRALYSFDRFLDWTTASGSLARDGLFRAYGFLEQASEGKWPASLETESGQGADQAQRSRAVQTAAVALTVAFLLTFSDGTLQLGWNLFTAEVALLAMASAMALRSVLRLSWGRGVWAASNNLK